MYFSTDKLYKLSKETLRGKKQEIVFDKLVNWTNERFEINVIYIEFEIDKKDNKHRLHLILESQKDYQKILSKSGYDKEIQSEISKKYQELLSVENQNNIAQNKNTFVDKFLLNIGIKSNLNKKSFENIWVCYSVFLTVYANEISGELSKQKIAELIKKYKKDNVWEIHMNSFYITIFVEKENQIEKNRINPIFEKIKEEYFEIVKEKDEFGLFKKEYINLAFDSKENFEKNYEGNWYYYYK
jgi:hypothetical protein